MGRYQIKFSKKAVKKYQKLPAGYKDLVNKELKKFEDDIISALRPIKGSKNIYRIRIGRYRILITMHEEIAIIADIGTRGDVYK